MVGFKGVFEHREEHFQGETPSAELQEVNQIIKLKSNRSIQEIFIILTKDNQWEIVEKKSFAGRFLAFKASIAKTCHCESVLSRSKETLIRKISAIKEQAHNQYLDLTVFDHLFPVDKKAQLVAQPIFDAKKAKTEAQDVVFPSGSKEIPSPQTSAKTQAIALPIFEDLNARREFIRTILIKKQITPKYLNANELEPFLDYLVVYAGAEEFLNTLDDPQSLIAVLTQAVSRGKLQNSILEKALNRIKVPNIQDFTLESEAPPNVTLETLSLVLGDSFLDNVQLDDRKNYSAERYIKLASEFLENQVTGKGTDKETAASIKLRAELNSYVNLSGKNLDTVTKEIKEHLETNKRCLILGGWFGHAIVYEIEKKENNRYVLRVFNQGEGVEYHKKTFEDLKTTYASSKTVDNIPEDVLFSEVCLGKLLTILQQPKGHEQLYPVVLQNLYDNYGFQEEPLDPAAKPSVVIQRSGTCTYRSFQSFLAYTLEESEYIQFKLEFKLFILKEYLPSIEIKKITFDNYELKNKEFQILTRIIAKYSSEINNESLKENSVVNKKTAEEVSRLLLDYEVELKKMQEEIFKFETKSMETSIKCTPEIVKGPLFNLPNLDQLITSDEIPPATFGSFDVAKLIANIPDDPNDKDFSNQIENCLQKLADQTLVNRLILYDQFFKKIGSLTNYKKIKFKNPELAINNLNIIINIIKLNESDATRNLMIFACVALSENALIQLPVKDNILGDSFPSFLNQIDLSPLELATYPDPFWSAFFAELKNLQTKQPYELTDLPYELPDLNAGTYTLSPMMAVDIVHWWNNHDESFSERIRASIQNDRRLQEEEIKNKQKVQQLLTNACNAKIADVERQIIAQENEKSLVLQQTWPETDQMNKDIIVLRQEEAQQNEEVILLERQLTTKNSEISQKRLQLAPYFPQFRIKNTAESELQRLLQEKKDLESQYAILQNRRALTSTTITSIVSRQNQIYAKTREFDTKINELKKQKEELEDQNILNKVTLDQIRPSVEEDAKYWPKNFEKTLPDEHRASFILGSSPQFRQAHGFDDWRPRPFLKFIQSALVAKYALFHGSENIPPNFDMAYHNNTIFQQVSLTTQTCNLTISQNYPFNQNQVVRNFTDDQWPNIYKNILQFNSPNQPETFVPSITRKFFNKNFNITKVSEEQFTELLSVRQHKNQIESILNYFEENPDKLSNSDWLLIFYSYLFESDILIKSIDSNPLLIKRLSAFFDITVNNAVNLNDHVLASNILWIQSHVQRYLDFIAKKKGVNLEKIFTAQHVINLFNIAVEAKVKKPLVQGATTQLDPFPQILESLVAASANLNLEETPSQNIGLICLINTLSNRFPATAQQKIDLKNQDIARAEKSIQFHFTNTKNTSKQYLSNKFNQLISLIYPEVGDFNPTGEKDTLISNDKNTKISLSTSRIQTKTGELNSYTQALKPSEKELLTNYELYSEKDVHDLRCEYQGARVLIFDKKNSLNLVIENKKVYIKINIANTDYDYTDYKWLEFIPKEQRNYITGHTELNRRYHHFGMSDKHGHFVYLIDKKTFKPEIQFSNNSNIRNFHTLDLRLTTPLKNYFSSFEDPQSTHLWSKSNEVEKIEFPRLNVTFSKKGNAFYLDSDPQWFISRKQFAPHLGPTTGFLNLENLAGQKKVLIPVLDPLPGAQKSTFSFPYTFDFQPEKEQIRLVECDLVGSKLIPKSLEARLHLASIYLEKGFLDLAEELLFNTEAEVTSRALDANETLILERILYSSRKSSESSGAKARIKLHALYILENNQSIYKSNNELTPDQINIRNQEKLSLINLYLDRLGHTKPLEKREELKLLGHAQDGEPPIIATRRRQLLTEESLVEIPKKVLPIEVGEVSGNLTNSEEDFYAYYRARANNNFPFDYSNIYTFHDGLIRYEKYLNNECEKFLTLPEGRRKSLIKMLSHADFMFSINRSFKDVTKLVTLINSFLNNEAQYLRSRTENTFPFNPNDIDSCKKYFDEYYPFIQDECKRFSKLNEKAKNSLFQLIEDISHYEDYEDIVNNLNQLIVQSFNSEQTPLQPPTIQPPIKRRKAPFTEAIKKESQSLTPLKLIKSSPFEATYLETAGSNSTREIQTTKIPEQALFSEKSPEITTESEKVQFAHMREDMKIALEKLNGQKKSEIKERINYFEDDLIDKQREESELLVKMESFIMNGVISALTIDPLSAIQFTSKSRSLPTLKELCVLCARLDSDEILKKLYPELSKEGIQNLKDAIKQYLVQKRFVQLLDRTKQKIDDLKNIKDEATAKNMRIELAASFKAKPAYELDDPLAIVLLTIETISNIKLREDQVVNVRKIYEAHEKGDQGLVLQMIMGGGKTSVIQPLLAFLFAKEGRLSTVILPRSLFAQVSSDLVKLLGSSYNQYVFKDPINVQLAEDSTYLKNYLKRLELAKELGGLVIMTPQDKYVIDASLKDAYAQNNQIRCDLLAQISKFFELNEVAQLDEIDMVLNPTVVYRKPIGQPQVIDTERADIVTEMILTLANDTEFAAAVSLDFINQFQDRFCVDTEERGQALTDSLFETKVAPRLAEIAKNLFQTKIKRQLNNQELEQITYFLLQRTSVDDAINQSGMSLSEVEKLMNQYAVMDLSKLNITDENHKLIITKIKEINERNQNISTIFNENEKNLLGVLAKSINVILKKSLFKECGSNYSSDPKEGVYTARPYFAPNSPKPSVPSDPYEMLILSIQNVLFNGVPKDAVQKTFKGWQKAAEEEMRDGCAFDETKSYKEYKRLMGEDAAQFSFADEPPDPNLISILQKKINGDKEALHNFFRDYLFKQIKFYPKSISTTPQALTGMSKKSCGYTGTMNTGILPQTMKGAPDLGTDGKTITVINQKIHDKTSEIREFSNADKTYPDQVVELFSTDPDLFVFIDSGNWLKEENLEEWVKKLIEKLPPKRQIEGIVFPNIDGKWLCCEKHGDTLTIKPFDESHLKTSPQKRLTIIPSKHETGTDIKQIPTAKAFVSIRKSMTMRDTLQSVFRMRQILEGQNVIFGISQELKNHIVTLLIQSLSENEPWKSLPSKSYENFIIAVKKIEPQTEIEKSLLTIKKNKWSDIPSDNFAQIIFQVAKDFKTDESVETFWNYLYKNQVLEQTSNNEIALNQKMQEVFEKPVRMVLNDVTIPYIDRLAIFNQLEDYFTPTQIDAPFDQMTQRHGLAEAQEVIEAKADKLMGYFNRIKNNSTINANIQKLYGTSSGTGSALSLRNALIDCAKGVNLPDLMKLGGSSDGGEIEMDNELEQEDEVEMEHETEAEIQQELEVVTPPAYLEQITYVPIGTLQNILYQNNYSIPTFFSLKTLLHPNDLLQNLLQKVDLRFSRNLFPSGGHVQSGLGSINNLPARYMLICNSNCTLVSSQDAAHIKEEMRRGSLLPPNSMFLMTLDGKIVTKIPQDAELILNEQEIKQKLVIAKIFTGRLLKREELTILEEIIKAEPNPAATALSLETLYNIIIKWKPDTKERYRRSRLKQLLTQLSKPQV